MKKFMTVETIDLATDVMFEFMKHCIPFEMKFDFANGGMGLYTDEDRLQDAEKIAEKVFNRFQFCI